MRKLFGLTALLGLGALVLAQSSGSGLWTTFSKALSGANTLSATYSVQVIGGSAGTYTVELKKPNLARIDKPRELIVADGTSIFVLDKAANTFYKKPQTAEELVGLLSADELSLWGTFFNEKMLQPVTVKSGGNKTRKGVSLNVLEANLDAKGRRVTTLYLHPSSKVPMQAEMVLNDPAGKETSVMDTKSVTLDGALDASRFAFAAPASARELSIDEISSAKWYDDLEEAKKVAKQTGKKIFVDFMAEWCGPCKKLDREVFQQEDWKKMGKYFVFLKIDVDEQQSVAKQYNIEAMPTQMVLDKNGAVLATTVGYANPTQFYAFINANK